LPDAVLEVTRKRGVAGALVVGRIPVVRDVKGSSALPGWSSVLAVVARRRVNAVRLVVAGVGIELKAVCREGWSAS
jgi:hypothetical protein